MQSTGKLPHHPSPMTHVPTDWRGGGVCEGDLGALSLLASLLRPLAF